MCWCIVGCIYFSVVSYLSVVPLVIEEVPFLLAFVAGVAEFIRFLARPFILMIRFGINILIGQVVMKYLAKVRGVVLFWPIPSSWDLSVGLIALIFGGFVVAAERAVVVGQRAILVLLLCIYLDEVRIKASFES